MALGLTAFEKSIDIRWSDLDSSRHVNNAVYLSYLEEVRTAWLERALTGRDQVHDFVVARVEIDFKRELTLEDGPAIGRCRLGRVGTSSVRTIEEIVTSAGELAAAAEAVLVARDSRTGVSRPLSDSEREALDRA
jgi:acyl-CoA thioester hydrolase